MRIGIIGSGGVAQTLAEGFAAEGHDVVIGSRDPSKLAEFAAAHERVTAGTFPKAASHAEVVILATKGSAAAEALNIARAENLAGKPVIDTTNPISDEPAEDGVIRYFTDLNESLMERLQAAFPEARFVKAFNIVGRQHMIHPDFTGGPPTMFICGNDDAAKADVTGLLEQVGWEVADYGTAVAARAIEPLCILWCIPGNRGAGWSRALKMLEA